MMKGTNLILILALANLFRTGLQSGWLIGVHGNNDEAEGNSQQDDDSQSREEYLASDRGDSEGDSPAEGNSQGNSQPEETSTEETSKAEGISQEASTEGIPQLEGNSRDDSPQQESKQEEASEPDKESAEEDDNEDLSQVKEIDRVHLVRDLGFYTMSPTMQIFATKEYLNLAILVNNTKKTTEASAEREKFKACTNKILKDNTLEQFRFTKESFSQMDLVTAEDIDAGKNAIILIKNTVEVFDLVCDKIKAIEDLHNSVTTKTDTIHIDDEECVVKLTAVDLQKLKDLVYHCELFLALSSKAGSTMCILSVVRAILSNSYSEFQIIRNTLYDESARLSKELEFLIQLLDETLGYMDVDALDTVSHSGLDCKINPKYGTDFNIKNCVTKGDSMECLTQIQQYSAPLISVAKILPVVYKNLVIQSKNLVIKTDTEEEILSADNFEENCQTVNLQKHFYYCNKNLNFIKESCFTDKMGDKSINHYLTNCTFVVPEDKQYGEIFQSNNGLLFQFQEGTELELLRLHFQTPSLVMSRPGEVVNFVQNGEKRKFYMSGQTNKISTPKFSNEELGKVKINYFWYYIQKVRLPGYLDGLLGLTGFFVDFVLLFILSFVSIKKIWDDKRVKSIIRGRKYLINTK